MIANSFVPGSGIGVIATQLYGPAYHDFNRERAIAKYGENDPDALKKLFANGEDKLIEPMINATAQVGLEYIGFKGIDDVIKMVPGAGSSLGKVAIAGGKEGFTEWGQYGLETLNISRGQGDNVAESTSKGVNAMFSKQGIEMWIAGVTGGWFISGSGRAINAALRSDKNSQKKFNDYVDTLYDLKTKKLLTEFINTAFTKDGKHNKDADYPALKTGCTYCNFKTNYELCPRASIITNFHHAFNSKM